MLEELQLLWKLQCLDIEIMSLEKRISEYPLKKEKANSKIIEIKGELDSKIEERERLLREKETKEKEIEQENQKIKNVEARLNYIKNHKDYLEVKKKIELAKKSNKLREDDVIKKMEEIETVEKIIVDLKEKLKKEEEGISNILKTLENEEKELNDKRSLLLEEREAATTKIHIDMLNKYDFIRKNSRGIALAKVNNETCEGCFMNVPPQLYNMVIRGDKIYQCPFCQRFLIYIKEDKAE